MAEKQYLERDTVLEALRDMERTYAIIFDAAQYDGPYLKGYSSAIRLIEGLPTVELPKPPSGEWDIMAVFNRNQLAEGATAYTLMCENCGMAHMSLYRDPKYCMECGAKMYTEVEPADV